MFDTDPFGHGDGTHTINIICKSPVVGGKLRLDKNHGDGRMIRWADIPTSMKLCPYVIRNIHRAFEYVKEETG